MATRIIMEHNYLKEFERRPPKEHSCEIWLKFQSIVSEEKFFKEKVYGRTHGRTDGRRHHAMTIARWPSASGAKNSGKREIAHYKQFFLFPQCFLQTFTADL